MEEGKLPPSHPRAKGGPRRTGLDDEKLKAELAHRGQWGAWGVESWNGVDVTWHVHLGGYQTAIAAGKLRNTRVAFCAIVGDPATGRLGAAFSFYSRRMTVPYGVTWIEAENTTKAAKAIWLKFVRGSQDLGYKWAQLNLLMAVDLVICKIPALDHERPSRVNIPLSHPEQGKIPDRAWKVWSISHYDHMQAERFAYKDLMVKPDCPVRFEEFTTPDESHPAVRAHVINYYTAMKLYTFGPPPKLNVPYYE